MSWIGDNWVDWGDVVSWILTALIMFTGILIGFVVTRDLLDSKAPPQPASSTEQITESLARLTAAVQDTQVVRVVVVFGVQPGAMDDVPEGRRR